MVSGALQQRVGRQVVRFRSSRGQLLDGVSNFAFALLFVAENKRTYWVVIRDPSL